MSQRITAIMVAEATGNIVILAPIGRDAALAETFLERAGFDAVACADMAELCAKVSDDTGVLLIAEEALTKPNRETLLGQLDAQPTWSDIPIIILAGEGELSRMIPEPLQEIAARANVTLLERPLRMATLITVVRSSLRARQRQLEVRDYLHERLASEKALLKAQREAEAANHAKSTFLTTMSHELRTPLNAIAGYTELLKMGVGGPVTDQQLQHLDRIEKSELHLLGLINDVLNFAKIEAGQVKLQIASADVGEVVRGMEAFIAPQLQAKSLRYEVNVAEDLVTATDEEKVRQILLNLLSNAIKFTPEGGLIRVDAGRNGDVIIEVTDTGEGIKEEMLEEIFEPFIQVGRNYTSPSEGTGLGLSISRDLAQRLGGDLTCRSVVGEGSTFTLTLPLET